MTQFAKIRATINVNEQPVVSMNTCGVKIVRAFHASSMVDHDSASNENLFSPNSIQVTNINENENENVKKIDQKENRKNIFMSFFTVDFVLKASSPVM